MHRIDNRELQSGFLTIILVVFVIGLNVYLNPFEKQKQGDAVVHTHEVLNQLDTLSNHLLDAETGQRGYLLTGQAAYLRSYSLAAERIESDVDRFQQLTRDNPRQQSQVPRLRKQIAGKLSELKETVDLRNKVSLHAALKDVVSGRGRAKMDAIRQQIDVMRAEEQRLLHQRMTVWVATEQTRWIFAGTAMLLTFLLGVVSWDLNRESLQRHRLFDAERQSVADHRVEAERLAKVVSIQRDMACVRQSLQATMQTITDRTREITQADGGVVAMLEGDELVCRAASGIAVPFAGLRWKIATSLAGRCVRENAVLTCSDTELDDRADRAASRRVGGRAAVVVPLWHNGQVIGVFTVIWSTANAFTEQDVVTLELMNGALSAALSDAIAIELLQASEKRLDDAQQTAHVGSWELDLATQNFTVSKETSRMVGIAPERREMNYAEYQSLYAPEDAARLDGYIERAVREGIGYERDVQYAVSQGETPRCYHVIGKPICDAQGKVIGLAGTLMDITERKHAEELLRENEARFRLLTEVVNDYAIFALDTLGRVTSWNVGAAHLKGYRAEEIIGTHFSVFYSSQDIAAGRPERELEIANSHGKYEAEGWRVRKNGEQFWASVTTTAMRDKDGYLHGYSKVTRDLTERRRIADALANQQATLQETNAKLEDAVIRLEALATTDSLTGLKNHGTFQGKLKEEYDRAVRYHTPLSVVILDVDRFKMYNDTYGHPAGDVVLKQVAQILQREARGTDIVARYGGEEFVLILPETGAEQARQLAERLRQAISSAAWEHDGVTASFGAATLSLLVPNAMSLVEEADKAMYRSKHGGRNSVNHF